MERRRLLKDGDRVVIIWTKKDDFTQIDAVFQTYIKRKNRTTPLFATKEGPVTGEECFWILKDRIRDKSDIVRYQMLLVPLQIQMDDIANKEGLAPVSKLKYKEIEKLAKQQIDRTTRLRQFIDRYGFDPADDTWIEEHLADGATEKKWFEYIRVHRLPLQTQKVIDLFNKENGESITLKDAMEMTKKKVRYAFGAFTSRVKGENDVEKWKKEAREFENKFKLSEQRMRDWGLSRNGIFPWVTTVKAVEFWPGDFLMRCIEKIPDVFLSPDCEFIKPGIALEVRGYDSVEKWIQLDFTPDVRERLTGSKDVLEDATYAIVLHPDNLDSLEGLDQLNCQGTHQQKSGLV